MYLCITAHMDWTILTGMQLSGSNAAHSVFLSEVTNSSFTLWQSYLVQLSFGGDQDSEGCQRCRRGKLVNMNLRLKIMKGLQLHCTYFNNDWFVDAWVLHNAACLLTYWAALSRYVFNHIALFEKICRHQYGSATLIN